MVQVLLSRIERNFLCWGLEEGHRLYSGNRNLCSCNGCLTEG